MSCECNEGNYSGTAIAGQRRCNSELKVSISRFVVALETCPMSVKLNVIYMDARALTLKRRSSRTACQVVGKSEPSTPASMSVAERNAMLLGKGGTCCQAAPIGLFDARL